MRRRVQAAVLALGLALAPCSVAAQPVSDRLAERLDAEAWSDVWTEGRRAIENARRALGADHPETLRLLLLTGRAELADGLPFHAIEHLEAAANGARTSLGETHPLTIEALTWLGHGHQATDRRALAAERYRQALAAAESALGASAPATAALAGHLGEVYVAQGRFAAAEPLLVRALAMSDASGGEADDGPTRLAALAAVYRARGAHEIALPLLERLVETRRREGGASAYATVAAMAELAANHAARGDNAGAEALFTEALAAARETPFVDDPAHTPAGQGYGLFLLARGRLDEAQPLLEASYAHFVDTLGPACADTINATHDLARLFALRGEPERALPLFRQAYARRTYNFGAGHPDTALSGWGLARLLIAGRQAPEEALEVSRQLRGAIEQRRRIGDTQPESLLGGAFRQRYC